MSSRIRVIVLTLSLLVSPAFAQQQEISVEAGADLFSQYLFRGAVITDKLTLQPAITLGFGDSGFSFNVWGSAAVLDRRTLDQGDELDFTVTLDRSLDAGDKSVGLSVGYIQYTFPSLSTGTKHSEEFFVGLSLDNPIAPSLTLYYDFGAFDVWYLNGAVGREFPLKPESNIMLGVSGDIGFSDATGSFTFNHIGVSASLNVSRGAVSFSPTIGILYSDKELNADETEIWGGISVSF